MPHTLYMDANATTPLLPKVVDAMAPFWTEHFANPSSVHQPGQRARAAIEHAREQVTALLRCRASEIIFTSGGTESDNLALFGAMDSISKDRPHLITSAIEHDAVLRAAEALARRGNVEVTVLPCTSSGRIDPATLEAALTPRTRLVSIMLANNETGVIQPVRELAALAHAAGALFHTDAVQAAGKLPLSVDDLGCDLLTLSGHKLYGPKGTGVLFIRRKTAVTPLHFGGPQERQRRAGTENVASLVGLGQAAELAREWLATDGPAHLIALRDRLEQTILAATAPSGVNGAGEARSPNTTNLFFDGIIAEDLMIALDLQGLAVSAGSACQSGALEPSHVLRAMGLTEARARATIRLSLTRLATEADADLAAKMIINTVRRLRNLGGASPIAG
jgi:cysteine desulfurase